MIKKIAVFLVLLGLSPFVFADDVILHEEGKTIHGKIIKEDDREVTIRVNGTMFLRVEKTKIKEIIRAQAEPVRNTVTMQTIRTSTASVGAETKSAAKPAATPVPAAEKEALRNVKPDFTTVKKDKGAGSTVENMRIATYLVNGKNFAEVKETITARDGGKGFLTKGRRLPSKTVLAFSWDGKTRVEAGRTKWTGLVMESTITVTYPEWKAPAGADDANTKEWNAFIADLLEHDKGHVDIYHAALRELGDTLANVDAANEEALRLASKNIVSDWQERTEKKQEGHDRRTSALRATAGKPLAPPK